MSILVSGSVAIDHIMVFQDRFRHHIQPDKLHLLNVSFHVPSLRKNYGGCAANIAFHLRLLGDDPVLLATVGSDFEEYGAWLVANGVRLDHLEVLEDEFTAQCFITTDLDDNQITAFHPGAMDRAHEASPDAVQETVDLAIVSPNGKRAMVENARALKARGVPVVVDPGQGLPILEADELIEMIDGSEMLVANDYEWGLIQSKTGLSESAIFERTGAVLVTRGEKGSTLFEDGRASDIAPVQADSVVDPTGCGDAFRAGLLHGRQRGLPLEQAARLGSLLGALKVAVPGPQGLRLDRDAILARFEREFGAPLE